MKTQNLFFTLIALCVATVVVAGTMASFKWTETDHDFGKIAQNKPVTVQFNFTNTGGEPLIVSKATGSCGCTGVEYPKEPIMPNQSGIIKATYNAAAIGPFTKSVTVESNAAEGLTMLRFQGEVTKADKPTK
ncbi:DUF1573 domain-containing protein [Persicitalea jodogahamensis]|uniref:DUF1573 domain-containing protein n=1 Tax=Persicitalea jodogahamensis TaxID=402147 RepID=A0A8J3D783_9BACT|nr:DUF1573 domain-containing protein [Persicitalea jodogahamensis]GHB83161.1 hypothetical protein GCM10007390_42660 [Persicitalea jodogahamensis]